MKNFLNFNESNKILMKTIRFLMKIMKLLMKIMRFLIITIRFNQNYTKFN